MKIVVFIIVLISQPVNANWSLSGESEKTSDQVRRTSMGLTYAEKKQSLLWAYENEPLQGEKILGVAAMGHQLSYPGQKILGGHIALNYGFRLQDNVHLIVGAGVAAVKGEPSNTSHSLFRPELILDYKIHENFFTSFSYKRDYVYQDLILNLTALELLESDTLSLNTNYRTNNWRFPLRMNQRWLSDSNRRFDIDAEAQFAIDQKKNWIWLGAGANYVTAADRAMYWSPSNSLSVGPRFEFSLKVNEPDLSIFGGASYNYIKEGSNGNKGYSLRLGISKGDRNQKQFNISGFVIDSTQSGKGWKTQGINASMLF